MKKLLTITIFLCSAFCLAQTANEKLINQILTEPSAREIKEVLKALQQKDLSPHNVILHDTVFLQNNNRLYILSHLIDGNRHYGAVVVPDNSCKKKPALIMATGGDGMHKQFDITQDFSHEAVKFPEFLGGNLDKEFIVIIPSFRGQQLIIGNKSYQSEGSVSDAFDGATTDAIAFLNVAIKIFNLIDDKHIAICGGSRGGAVALLAASRDKRIKSVIAIAAPTDMKALYLLYPEKLKLLFFNDLLAGKISEKEARKKFIASSPIHFIDELPKVQLHHDKQDPFVPIDFAHKLVDKMKSKGKNIESYYYNEGVHGFWGDPIFWVRVQNCLKEYLNK
jgi:dipeptidyl aminopeptidase/acylaminoacyl peptidase